MVISNQLNVLSTLKDLAELRFTLKHETLQTASECTKVHLRHRRGFAKKMLQNIEESHIARSGLL